MNYWLVKSEPGSYSWDDLKQKNEEVWDGVRNYQARNFLKEMKLKDPVLFYHSGKDKAIVGIAEVTQEAFPDPKDQDAKDWVAVKIRSERDLKVPVTLDKIKQEDSLSEMLLLKQSRLSVMSVAKEDFETILKLSES
ncbi:EVE domain-containing protein [Pararhodonellum marinum]|uniref:EVE domain-containing protein n=1 Tax=Pararhodonellum marinum TaxID=2755358 RepID=UPI0018901715|nr:EVE domain-containing protein [Pararhodonellum marinum]